MASHLPGRPVSWRDFPQVYAYRGRVVCLESRAAAIGAPGVVASVMTALLSAATGIAAVMAPSDAGQEPLLAVATAHPESALATWLYLAPAEALAASPSLAPLAEALLAHPALGGARALLAETPQQAPWLPALRAAGFRVVGRHEVWRGNAPQQALGISGRWVWPHAEQRWEAERLYANLVPPLLRTLLPSPVASPMAVVYVEGGEVRGVAEAALGAQGVWLSPWLDPDLHAPAAVLANLAAFFHPGRKPVYFAVRDAQGWLKYALQRLEAHLEGYYALLVRWRARPQTVAETLAAHPVTEATHPTLSAP